MSKLAIAQHPPVLLDREKTLDKAVDLISEAAGHGAELVVFPEAFIPGYPIWMWRLRPGSDMGLTNELYARLFANAIDLASNDLAPLRLAASEHSVTVVCGINERDSSLSRGTLYNTVVVIGSDGAILNRHRKLMPTNPERMVHGFGDASGLRVVETPAGRIGALVCWENFMPLARYALYAQGVEIYIAPTYDAGDAWIGTLQHIAREGRCWVAGSGFAMRVADIPEDFPARAELYPDADAWVNPGDSVVVSPDGTTVAGPLREDTGFLYAEVDTTSVAAARRSLDVAGHYARPDVFELRVRREPQKLVTFD